MLLGCGLSAALGQDSDSSVSGAAVADIRSSGDLSGRTNVVADIAGVEVPYPWFLHEFRSSFFRYGEGPEVRREVFRQFMRRMVLYVEARASEVAEDADLKRAIASRVETKKAFMEYQLAMTEVEMLVEAYLASRGLGRDMFSVTDEEVDAFAQEELARMGRSGDVSNVPPHVLDQMRDRLAMDRRTQAVNDLADLLLKEKPQQVNDALVDQVPFPEINRTP